MNKIHQIATIVFILLALFKNQYLLNFIFNQSKDQHP